MKKFFEKIKKFFSFIGEKLKTFKEKITPKWWKNFIQSDKHKKVIAFLNKYSLLTHIPLSLAMVFVLEWLSRHSFVGACSFVAHHTGAYLYNAYVIFVVYTLCYVFVTQTAMRMTISGLLITFGIVNCIVLLNRVTPFGFTDMSMISDLLTMQNTNYFSAKQAAVAVFFFALYVIFLVRLFVKGSKCTYKIKAWIRIPIIVLCFLSVPLVTSLLQGAGVLSSYFGNLRQGYFDYGYVYGFSTSMLDRGMDKPFGYSSENVLSLVEEDEKAAGKTDSKINGETGPNIVIVLLESFCDVDEINFLECSEDPIPFFHYLEKNYSTGYCTVPVVGAGTCNSEFEVLTGMSCQFFGPGEYPQKTVLKQVDRCESIASNLTKLGYSTHVVHNNGGNFYSRANAFTLMGFDTFISKEMLDITEYTPMGSWPTDDILIDASRDAMDMTPERDLLYTITVETHGDYPTEVYPNDLAIQTRCKGKDEALSNQWQYYVNRVYNMDDFMKLYCKMLDERGEDTLVIMFGDHFPTMGLTDDEVGSGDLYKTKYVTWNNFGMPKEDMDLTTYQLVAEYMNRLNIHEGTIFDYHQRMMADGVKAGTSDYMNELKTLQYDLLYGNKYAYDGKDLYPASNLVMGVHDIVIDRAIIFNGKLHIYGDNFSKWSKVFVNDEKVNTTYESGQCLTVKMSDIEDGAEIVVNQMGSNNTIFRSSNKYKVTFPDSYKQMLEDEEAEE